jgi:hypothetical protein
MKNKLVGLDITHLDIKDVKGKPIENLTELQRKNLEANCNCGVDCCEGIMVLPDVATGVAHAVYFKNGVLVTKTYEAFKTNGI